MPKTKSVPHRQKSLQKSETVRLSALAHISFVFCLLLLVLSAAVPAAILVLERRRAKPRATVEFHARQALCFQLAAFGAALVLLAVSYLLVPVIIGLFLVPFVIMAFLAAVGYAVYGGWRLWNGKRFKYKFLTDWIERRRSD
jgi:hypothetical protein